MTFKSDSPDVKRLTAELDTMLSANFLQFAMQGGIFQAASAQLACAQAAMDSKGEGVPRQEREQCIILHDELVRLVRSGLCLTEAVHIARRQGRGQAAFQKLQELVLDRMEGQTA